MSERSGGRHRLLFLRLVCQGQAGLLSRLPDSP